MNFTVFESCENKIYDTTRPIPVTNILCVMFRLFEPLTEYDNKMTSTTVLIRKQFLFAETIVNQFFNEK